jgi:O-antigen/teichoic acid export membrane protein
VSVEPGTAISAEIDVLDSRSAGGVFVRGSGMRMVAYFGAVAVSVGATTLLTRHLHKIGYGRYVAVTSLLLIVMALTEGGLANLGVREFSTGLESERRAFMRNLIGLRIALSSVGGVGAIAFTLLGGYPVVVVEGTVIASAGLVLATLQGTVALPLTTGLRLGWLAVLDFIGPATTAVGLVVLALIGAPLLPFFAAAVVAFAVTLSITAVLVRRQVTLRPAFAASRWRGLLRQSVVFAAATALGTIYFQVVVVAMSLLTTAAAVGIFGLAFRILSVVNGIPLLLVGSAFPILLRAARDDHSRLRYAVQRLVEGDLLIGGWLSLVLVAGAPFAVSVMGGSGYPGSVGVLEILAPGVIATFLSGVFLFTLLSLRMYRTMITINAVMIVLAVVLCALLIPAYGATGAATVTLSLEVVLACSCGVALFVSHPQLRPVLGTPARIVIALALAYTLALLVPLAPVFAAAAGSALLAVLVIALRVVPRELWAALRQSTALGDTR